MMARVTLPALALIVILAACASGEADADTVATSTPAGPTEISESATADESRGVVSATSTPMPPTPTITNTPTATVDPEPTIAPTREQSEPTGTLPEGPAPLDQINLDLELVVDRLDRPVGFAVPDDGSGRIFILEKEGRIRIVEDGKLLRRPFLDISDQVDSEGSEQGLIGLAFHPEYVRNGYFYVNYTNLDGDTVVSRFMVSDNPNRADSDSETLILFVDQPHDFHNGGHLTFGPDGYLWIGLGDGGAASDIFENAQNPETLLGSILRIDVTGDAPYDIPDDNPFVGDPDGRDEVWAYGLRNPWRFSFDPATGDLYIADVGQGGREEINFVPAVSKGGENFGWSLLEGTNCFNIDPCDIQGLTPPITEYGHDEGNCAITGGHVYRGDRYPALEGVYLYADFCSGRFWGLRVTVDGVESRLYFQRKGALFSAFGVDEDGEIYVLGMDSGALYRVVAF